MKHLFATTAFALALLMGAAQAGTITYTARGSETVSVPMFDPTLGFLTAVDYRMTGTKGAIDTDNAYSLLNVRADAYVKITFLNQSKQDTATQSAVCGFVTYDPYWGTECSDLLEVTAYAMAEIVRSLSIENGDNVPAKFTGTSMLVGKAEGYAGPRHNGRLSTTLSITYTFADAPPDPLPAAYAALPLPASAPLLLAGLGGIAALRRRSRKRLK